MLKYQNRMIFTRYPEVFKSTLYYELNKYYEYLKHIPIEYEELSQASTDLGETVTNTGTIKDEGKVNDSSTLKTDGTNTHNITRTPETTTTSTIKTEGTNDHNITHTPDTTTTSTNSGSNTTKTLGSDYPQSNVSQTLDPTFNYTYASQSTTNQETLGTSNTTKNTGTDKTDDLNTIDTTETNTTTSSGTDKTDDINTLDTTETNTREGTNEYQRTNDLTRKTTKDGMTQFDKLIKLLDWMDKHPYPPIFQMIEKLDKYFLSWYIDEEREDYIPIDLNLLGGILE